MHRRGNNLLKRAEGLSERAEEGLIRMTKILKNRKKNLRDNILALKKLIKKIFCSNEQIYLFFFN